LIHEKQASVQKIEPRLVFEINIYLATSENSNMIGEKEYETEFFDFSF
jgi:hypothetical protein